MQRFLFRTAGALIAFAAANAQSQPDTVQLGRMTVIADRLPRSARSTPSSITVLEGETLRRAGIVTLADALRSVPGFGVVRSGSIGAQTSLFVRGGESDYTRVLIDGVAMNEPGGAIDLGALTLDNVERIEILRGPASVVYGGDAVTGVVHIHTLRPVRRSEGALSLRGGSFGTSIVDLAIGASHERGSVSSGFARYRSDGILPFNNEFAGSVATFRGEISSLARLALRRSESEFHYPTDGAGNVVDRNAFRSERRTSAGLEFSRSVARKTDFQLTLSALDVQARTEDARDDAADTLGFNSYDARGSLSRGTADARMTTRLSRWATSSIGVSYEQERQRSVDSSNYDLSRNRFLATRLTRSAYGQVIGDVQRLSYSLGARYDDNDAFGIFRTARANAALSLWRGGSLRAGFGSAFKSPAFIETFSTAFSIGNRALRPERSRGWELGLTQRSTSGAFEVSATYFAQRFRDLIQYTYRTATEPNYFNVAATSARGLELEARTTLSEQTALWANLTALRTRVERAGFDDAGFARGSRLLRRTPLTIGAGAIVRPTRRSDVTVSLQRVGQRDDRDFATFPATPVTLPSYFRVDVAGGMILPSRSQGTPRLTLRIENALGARYQEVANFSAPGRTVTLGVRLAFGSPLSTGRT